MINTIYPEIVTLSDYKVIETPSGLNVTISLYAKEPVFVKEILIIFPQERKTIYRISEIYIESPYIFKVRVPQRGLYTIIVKYTWRGMERIYKNIIKV